MEKKLQQKLYNLKNNNFLKKIIILFFYISSAIPSQAQFVLDTLNDVNSINSIREINDTIFIATDEGIYYYDSIKGKGLQSYFSDVTIIDKGIKFTNEIYDIIKFHENIYCFTSNNIININSGKKTKISITNSRFIKTSCISSNFLYVALSEKSIYKYKEQNNQLQVIDSLFVGKNTAINNIFCDTENTVWIASSTGLYSINNSSIKKHKEITEAIYCINQKKNNELYLGGNGAIWTKTIEKKTFSKTSLCCMDNRIKQIDFGKNDSLWFASEEIAGIIVDKTRQNYNYIANKQSTYATSIYALKNKDTTYVGTEGKGIFVFSSKNLTDADALKRVIPHKGKGEKEIPTETSEEEVNILCDGKERNQAGANVQTIALSSSRKFKIYWSMGENPDKLIVYQGKNKNNILWERNSLKGNGSRLLRAEEQYITIEIIDNKYSGTKWKYHIVCLD